MTYKSNCSMTLICYYIYDKPMTHTYYLLAYESAGYRPKSKPGFAGAEVRCATEISIIMWRDISVPRYSFTWVLTFANV